MFFILLQFLLLTATSAGWAAILKRLLKIESPWSLSLTTLLFGAGFAVQILLLQNLVYCNIPVQTAFALPAAIGFYGVFLLVRNLPPLSPSDRNRAAAVLAAVFFVQVFSALVESPSFFYGKGHTDQFNYTVLSQFILTQPFHSTAADIHLQPWLTRTHEFKEWRIGQAVAQAYAASLSFSNTKEAYAGISSFCLALLALVTYSLARALAIPANLSVTAALWTGLAPALTRYHLEGFLSQSVSLFVLPFLGLWARTTTRKPGYAIALPAIALAYLLVCYVELLPVGLVAFAALAVYLLSRDGVRRLAPSIAAVLLSILLVPYALVSSFNFLIIQLERAGQRPQSVEAQAGLAGTIPGWIQGLVGFPFLVYPLQLLTALTLTGLAGFAIYKSSRRTGAFLSALLAPPVLILAYLFLQTPLAKYPFSKLQDSYVYLWILLPVAGLSRLRQPQPALIFTAVLTLFAALGSYNHNLPILQHAGILQTLQSKETVASINYAESHRGRTYLVNHADPYAAGWLAYHARDSKAYLTPPRLADFSLNQSAYEFTRVPNYLPGLILLSQTGVHSQEDSGGVPTLDVSNPQGEERDTADVWYWLADNLDIDINRWDNDPRPVEYKFKVRVDPGPSNPSTYRKMRMTNSRTGISSIIETNGGQTPVIPLILAPGRNAFFFELLEPTQPTVNLPHDGRKLMVRLVNPAVSDPRPIEKPDPALLRAIAGTVPVPPQIKASNPQGEDKSEITSWFWVAQNMDLQIRRTDSDPADHIYQLNFRAAAGFASPDPARTIRLTHAETGTETILKLSAPALLSATLNLKPGVNNVKLELVNAPPQTVKAPGDARVHMLRVEEFGLRYLRANN